MSSWTSSRAISVGIDSRILVVAWLNLAHFEEKRARNSALPQAYLRHLGVGGRRYKQRHGHGGRAHGRHIRHFGRTIDEIHEVAVGMPEPACERLREKPPAAGADHRRVCSERLTLHQDARVRLDLVELAAGE